MEKEDIILDGSKECMEKIYARYSKKALRLAMSIIYHEDLALDAVQEAFIRVYKYGKKFDYKREFEPWFMKIVSNESKRVLKKNKKYVELDESYMVLETDVSEDNIKLQKALQMLKSEDKEILSYKYLLGYTEKEIANIMKKPLGTVKSKLFYARKKLANFIGKESE